LNVIKQILSPGGKLAFAEPNMLNPQIFAERTFLRNHNKYVSPDEIAVERWKINKLMIKLGFINVQVIPFDLLHPLVP